MSHLADNCWSQQIWEAEEKCGRQQEAWPLPSPRWRGTMSSLAGSTCKGNPKILGCTEEGRLGAACAGTGGRRLCSAPALKLLVCTKSLVLWLCLTGGVKSLCDALLKSGGGGRGPHCTLRRPCCSWAASGARSGELLVISRPRLYPPGSQPSPARGTARADRLPVHN